MFDKDRIRLAEALGWVWHDPYWVSTGEPPHLAADIEKYLYYQWPAEEPPIPPFDPFTDANDDYAVLEWMRKNVDPWESVENAIMGNGVADFLDYRIGDFARAALRMLCPTETEDDFNHRSR